MPKPLKLNGKPFDLNRPSPALGALKEKLDTFPEDEVFTGPYVCKKTGISPSYLRDNGASELFTRNSLKISGTRYWGSPKAIAALRAQVER